MTAITNEIRARAIDNLTLAANELIRDGIDGQRVNAERVNQLLAWYIEGIANPQVAEERGFDQDHVRNWARLNEVNPEELNDLRENFTLLDGIENL